MFEEGIRILIRMVYCWGIWKKAKSQHNTAFCRAEVGSRTGLAGVYQSVFFVVLLYFPPGGRSMIEMYEYSLGFRM